MINVGDVGNDYEHCLQLKKKLNEFRGATSGVRDVFHAHVTWLQAAGNFSVQLANTVPVL